MPIDRTSTSDQVDHFPGSTYVLLIFAPSERDPSYEQQLRQVESLEPYLERGEIRLGRILMEETSYIGEHQLGEQEIRALRRRFDLEENAFQVILVGKEGDELGRYDAPIRAGVILQAFTLPDVAP